MNRLGTLGRFTLTLTTALVLAALVLPVTTLGANAKITFTSGDEYEGLRIGGPCVTGQAPANRDLHLVWKSSAGTLKANVHVQTIDSGAWSYCSVDGDALTVGDKLKATVGAYTRSFVVPTLTLNIDRVQGVFRGRAPAGTSFVMWFIHRGCCADFVEDINLTADSTGKWVYDNDGFDVDGYEAHMEWSSAKGDFLSVYDFAAEATVRINRSNVTGYSDPLSAWKLALWDPALGTRKGVASGVTDEWGSFSGVFVDADGDPVNVLVGDKVVGTSLASDMKFIVRDIQATADVATDFVTGSCGNIGPRHRVDVLRNGHFIGGTFFLDFSDEHNFTVDFTQDEDLGYTPANIRHGDRLLVTCGTPNGDFVMKKIIVP